MLWVCFYGVQYVAMTLKKSDGFGPIYTFNISRSLITKSSTVLTFRVSWKHIQVLIYVVNDFHGFSMLIRGIEFVEYVSTQHE